MEGLLPDVVIKYKAHNKPQRVLRRVGGRDVARRVEKDGHVDITYSAVWVAAVEHVDQYGSHRPDEEEEHQRRVHLAGLEHPLRADGSPDQRGIVVNLGPLASEALSIVRGAQIRDVAHHPAEHAGLDGGGEDGGVDLADEKDPWRDFKILTKLEILGEIHAVFHSIVAEALYHHVGDGLAGPGIARDELGDDIEEADEELAGGPL